MAPRVLVAVASASDRVAQWAAIALGLSIPVSVALDNLLLALVAAGWLLSGDYRGKWEALRSNPVAIAAVALFALLAVGTLYGTRHPGDGAVFLGKCADLVFVPVFAFLFRDAMTRSRALHALAISLAVILAASYLTAAGVIPRTVHGDPHYPVVFKHRLTHNILMAYGAFLFVLLAVTAATRSARLFWSALVLAAVLNVVFMIQGATGYLVLGALLLYLGHVWRGWRGVALAVGAAAVFTTALTSFPGAFQQKVTSIASEVVKWRPGAFDTTSTGSRLELYRNSLAIVREHPLLGVGTGGFPRAHDDAVSSTDSIKSRNPHNEYLHITVQVGIAGLALLLYLFYAQWRNAPRLASQLESHVARGLVLTIAIGCLFNSLLLDHTEGLLYAWLTGLCYAGLQSKRDA